MSLKAISTFTVTFLLFAACSLCFAEGTTLQDMVLLDTSEKMVNAQINGDIVLADGDVGSMDEEEDEDDEE